MRSSPGARAVKLSGLMALSLVFGCADRGSMPPSYPVSGKITVDGEPLADGAIEFEPADGKGGVYGGPIRGGKCDVMVAPGPKKVSIIGMKQQGAIGPDGNPMATQFLPPKYNSKTELTATIEPRSNALSFDLSMAKQAAEK